MFTVKDLKRFRKCPRLFYRYYTFDFQEIDYIKMDDDISELIINKLDIKNPYVADESENINDIDSEHILNISFEFMNLKVTVPYMRKINDTYDIYFFDSSVEPKVSRVKDYSMVYWVLKKNDVNIDRMKIIHLNKRYVKGDQNSRSTLLKVTGSVYSHGHYVGNVTKLVKRRQDDYSKNLDDMYRLVNENDEPEMISTCKINTKCDFREHCYKLDD